VLLTMVAGVGSPGRAGASPCTPASVTGTPTSAAGLTGEQLQNAGIIIATGQAIPGVGPAGEVVAVAAALTESRLINLPSGDRDSLGLFQERPSQGWGSAAQIMDPVYAATQFYLHLLAVPGWQQMPPGDAAQAVERSAFPGRYAANVPLAIELVANAVPASAGTLLVLNNCPPAGTIPVQGGNLPPDVLAGIAAAPTQVQAAIAFALAQLGKPYVWGAAGPDSFDCSGLAQTAYGAAGVALPRTTYEQVLIGRPVDRSQLAPGDLVLPDAGHVQIYLGGGLVVEAPHTGAVVRVVPMWGFWQARRVI
jgi:cell wall-associated NlpC family hydrolase